MLPMLVPILDSFKVNNHIAFRFLKKQKVREIHEKKEINTS